MTPRIAAALLAYCLAHAATAGQAAHNDGDPNDPCGASVVRWPSSRRKRNWIRVVDQLLLDPEIRDALSLNKSGDTVYRSGDAGFELRFVGIEQEPSDDARRVMMREIQSLPIDGIWRAVMVHNQLADERGELP